jgi:RecA-family ATPase
MMLAEPLRGADLLTASAVPPDWLWEGFLVRGQVTLLTSAWKCGKSTLLALLLAERPHQGVLLGRVVTRGGSAVVTEEPASLWMRRARELGFGPDLSLFCRPFAAPPSPAQWDMLIDRLAQEQEKNGVDLVVLDPLISVLPCSENEAQRMSHALHALRRLTDRGLAVLILHHPSKEANPRPGHAARG